MRNIIYQVFDITSFMKSCLFAFTANKQFSMKSELSYAKSSQVKFIVYTHLASLQVQHRTQTNIYGKPTLKGNSEHKGICQCLGYLFVPQLFYFIGKISNLSLDILTSILLG